MKNIFKVRYSTKRQAQQDKAKEEYHKGVDRNEDKTQVHTQHRNELNKRLNLNLWRLIKMDVSSLIEDYRSPSSSLHTNKYVIQ